MSLMLLYKDELKGFSKSKVILALWIGLPVLVILLHIINPKTRPEMPLAVLSALIVSSVSGTLSSAMLAVNIVHEKLKGVYPLFLIRPIKRRDLLLGKFLAVYSCIAVAALITIAMGLAVDHLARGGVSAEALRVTLKSLLMSLAIMAISSSAGVLIGVMAPSVLVAVILVLYGGNQISSLAMLPSMFKFPSPELSTAALGAVTTFLLLLAAIKIFNKKQF